MAPNSALRRSSSAVHGCALLPARRSYATQSSIQLGATSPQDVGALLAAASAGEVDKMREVLERKTCTVNDGDYDRRKVPEHSVAQHMADCRA